LFIAFFVFPCLSPAQQGANFTQAYAAADSQLNAAYKQALSTFARPKKEVLRRAERAWLAFSESEKILVTTLQNENLVTDGFSPGAVFGEVVIRTTHLRTFFAGNSVPIAEPSRDQHLLNEAELAWITYCDADSASMLAAYGNPTIPTAAAANLNSTRGGQLLDIIQSLDKRKMKIAKTIIQEPASSQVQNNAANSKEAKAIDGFRNEAKAVLDALLAKEDDPLLKKPDGLRNVPELPTELGSRSYSFRRDKARRNPFCLLSTPHSRPPSLKAFAAQIIPKKPRMDDGSNLKPEYDWVIHEVPQSSSLDCGISALARTDCGKSRQTAGHLLAGNPCG
jgi:uncharacterized protein YecT (DUF1311 family)